MIKIPSDETRKFKVSTDGDSSGQIVSVRNMNFEKKGLARIAKRVIGLMTSDEDADFDRPVAFAAYNREYVVVTPDDVWNFDPTSVSGAITNLTPGSGSDYPNPTLGSDAVVFNEEVVVSSGTKLNTYAGGGGSGWNEESGPSLSSANPHPMCVIENRLQLAVGDGNVVKYYDDTYTLQETLVLPDEYVVVWIRWRQNLVYIGTRNTAGRNAKMFITDGASTSAQAAYDVGSDWTFAGCEYGSSVAIVNSIGQILKFNGGGFSSLDGSDPTNGPHFPVYYSPYQWRQSTALVGSVCQRGMVAEGGILHIMVDASLDISQYEPDGQFLNDMPSGLWDYDPQVGLYPRAGCATAKYFDTSPTSVSDSTFAYEDGHRIETGDPVFTQNVGSLTGLTLGRTYFAFKVSETEFKLALTPADAINEHVLEIGGTMGAAKLAFPNFDTGSAVHDVSAGAVQVMSPRATFSFYGSVVLYGADVMGPDGQDISVLMSLGLGRNIGSMTTARILSSEMLDTQQKLYVKFRDFDMPLDRITVKYRTSRRLGLPTPSAWDTTGRAVWTGIRAFLVDPLLKAFRQVQAGDEIEVISGAAAGQVSHVADVAAFGDEILITLEDDMEGALIAEMSDVVADNWTECPAITIDTETVSRGFAEIQIGELSGIVELKIEVRGTKVAIEQIKFISDGDRSDS